MADAIAIIGGTGFIGQAVAQAAMSAGHQPVLLGPDADPTQTARGVDAPHLPCDITDRVSLDTALQDVQPDGIIHLAAFGAGQRGLLAGAKEDPATAVAVNIGGFVNVVESSAAAGLERVVWSSSTTVYGPKERYGPDPVDERAVLAPQSVYGATKAAAELISESLWLRGGCRAVGMRLPLVYGPGRWYGGSQEQLVGFVADIAKGRPARLEATEDVVDWIYIDDAATAMLSALTADDPAQAYNLVGHRASLADLGRALATHATAPAQVDVIRADAPAPPLIDDSAARTDLGFAPRFDLLTAAADYIARTKESL